MDGYFAPRKKLTRRQCIIRGVAVYTSFYVAVASSYCFAELWQQYIKQGRYMKDWASFLTVLFVVALLQSVFAVPIWRCYCLRLWGSLVTFFYCLLFSCLLLGFLLNFDFLPITITLSPLFFIIIADEGPNLKSGF